MVLYCTNRILMIKFIKFPQLTRCHRNRRYERSINSSNRQPSCSFSSPIKAYLQCISSYNGSKIFYNCLTNTACFFLDTEILLYTLSLHFCCQIAINKSERKMKFCIFIQTCFFFIRGNLTFRKVHFVGSGERVKPRLSQAFTRGACPDSNSRPAMQISSPLPSRHAPGDFHSNP